MITAQDPKMDTTFTQSWSKYFYTKRIKKQDRENAIDDRLLRTEKYKDRTKEVSEYDHLAYMQ